MVLDVLKKLIYKHRRRIFGLSLYFNVYLSIKEAYFLLMLLVLFQIYFSYKEKNKLGVLALFIYGLTFPFFAVGTIVALFYDVPFMHNLYSYNSFTAVVVWVSGTIIVSIFILDKLKITKAIKRIYTSIKEAYDEVKKESLLK